VRTTFPGTGFGIYHHKFVSGEAGYVPSKSNQKSPNAKSNWLRHGPFHHTAHGKLINHQKQCRAPSVLHGRFDLDFRKM